MINTQHAGIEVDAVLGDINNSDIIALMKQEWTTDGNGHTILDRMKFIALLEIYHRALTDANRRLKKLEDEVLVWKDEV